MTKIKEIVEYLEQLAPTAYQESYDNSGLLAGNSDNDITGILITLDCTEEVVREAVNKKCNLIIAHHPIIFKGIKKLTGETYVERTLIEAIQHDISIYAIHTNLDNIRTGVNHKIAEKIGLKNCRILMPKSGLLSKLETFVPMAQTNAVLESLFAAGAGNIGKYGECSFQTKGKGTFRAGTGASPFLGKEGAKEEVNEVKIEVIFSSEKKGKVLQALRESHPYEEIAYYVQEISNEYQDVGSGLIGELETPMEPKDFLLHLKSKMSLNTIRHTSTSAFDAVRHIAICGGSGSFLLPRAKAASADVFVTADFKYHEFFDAENRIIVADIGHYESEVYTKELIYDILSKNFSNFPVNLSETVTNPISYL